MSQMSYAEDQKRKRAIAKQVARLLAESRTTYADLPEIFRFTSLQLMCQVQEDSTDAEVEVRAETEGEKEVKKLDQNERRKKYEEIHAKIKSSSNKKILRQQLELLAEHSRICGIDQIPECSEAMVRVAQELNYGIRETILFALLAFGVSFYLLYSLSVKLIKLCRRK